VSWNYRIVHDTSEEDEERWYVAEYYDNPPAYAGPSTPDAYRESEESDQAAEDNSLDSIRWQLEEMQKALDRPIVHWDGRTIREDGPVSSGSPTRGESQSARSRVR